MKAKAFTASFLLLFFAMLTASGAGIVFDGETGPGLGKHIVLISGDEEYRSEEAMPMLGKILSKRYGFKCTTLFAINKETGEIDPDTLDNIPGLAALDTADLMIVFTRFRDLPDEQMKYIHAYLQTGKPVIGIRPSVVAFRNKSGKSSFPQYSFGQKLKGGFGLNVLGADWISHHGKHKVESTLGIPVEAMKRHPILRGVESMWGKTDVYTVKTPIPDDGQTLVMGQVLQGMSRDDPPSDKAQMPLAWVKRYPTPGGDARVFMTTMGDAQDFRDEHFRRMVVNACLWAMGLEDRISAKSNVDIVGYFNPSPFGFRGFRKGLFPDDYAHVDLFEKGDRICYIGNALADRMQHFGWLETLTQDRFPEKELVFRNLGFSADELTTRPRSKGFGEPDVHLNHSRADVIYAFFGYNESFAGDAGLQNFREDLDEFIDHTLSQKYNRKRSPRLVLFSPIAHEDLHDPNLPDGKENNERLALYTNAMREVAEENGVGFVDLFSPTKTLYVQSKTPLTINGIHLNSEGNRQLAEVIDTALNGGKRAYDESKLQKIRESVLDKNLRWFNRYRATDGYSTYGGRADLKFVNDQSNREVLSRELEILDVMTANRDKKIWARAQGSDLYIDDDNLPRPIPVITNIGGGSKSSSAEKEGSKTYLSGEEAISKMTVAKGMEVNLFASEERFPELVNPVQMSVDTDGRIWVAAWHTYPHWDPNKELNDKLLIFPDDDGDGKADRCIVFADQLHNPTGFEFWNGGVLVTSAPEILFLKDTDGDDKADVTIRYLQGVDSADTHCAASSYVYGPDGCMYFDEGIFHYTNIETPWAKPLRVENGNMIYRFNPRTYQISKHFNIRPNPHGIVIDPWGYLFATDGTSGRGYYVGYPGKGTPHELYEKRVRPVAGLGRLSGSHFPEENQGNLLICNTIGFLGVLQYEPIANGADINAVEREPIVVSTDGNFRPADVEIGADGALYILDWQNVIIGHMQHNLRDPSRDHSHGRIYRVTVPGRPLLTPVKMSDKSIAALLPFLESPEDRVRYRARIELSGRDTEKVLSSAKQWIRKFDTNNLDDAQSLLEALYLYQQHNVLNEPLLRRVLKSPVPRVRAAATRTIGQWGTKIKDGAILLQEQAQDTDAMVRAETVVAAAAFEGLDAAEALFLAKLSPTDPQLDYNIEQTRQTLEPYWKQALNEGKTLSPAGQNFVEKIKLEAIEREKQLAARKAALNKPAQPKAHSVIHLKTVPEKMKYDLATFTVTAGKSVDIIFENPDFMPHNLLIVEIGAMEAVGLLADTMAADPTAIERHYVPDSPKVLYATESVADHSKTVLRFIAPEKPGDYPYVCTFPGHWRLMNGVMKVVP